jgi:hypothetical protein
MLLSYLFLLDSKHKHSCISLRIGSNAACGPDAHGGQHSPSRTEMNSPSFEQGKH